MHTPGPWTTKDDDTKDPCPHGPKMITETREELPGGDYQLTGHPVPHDEECFHQAEMAVVASIFLWEQQP